jgi:H+/Cl- antiporter ClcA
MPAKQSTAMHLSLQRSRQMMFSPKVWKTRLVFWLGALTVGGLAAFFALASEWANNAFKLITSYSKWSPLLICPVGLLLVSWLTNRFFPRAEGSGIPQCIAALEITDSDQRSRLLSLRIAIGKILLTFLGLLCGASIGREGPTIHVGASIMHSLGKIAKFPRHELERGLILAGGAAGIAAAFNTPIAGIIFAIEEMSRSFEERSSGTLLIAVIIAGVTALAIQGDYTYFGSTAAALTRHDWLVIPVAGIVGGLLGGAFALTLIVGSRRIKPYLSRHPYRVAVSCGLLLALLGLLAGGTSYGTGYHETKGILTAVSSEGMLFPLFKIAATVVSYLSGIPGGIFAPSLAAGAGVGADLAHWFPTTPAAAVVILGMVSYFAGVVQTPITAFVIVMEMTDNHSMLFPLMTASFMAYGASRLICHESIYWSLAQAFFTTNETSADTTEASAPAAPSGTT